MTREDPELLRPSQQNVSFPIALPLVKVGRSVGQKKMNTSRVLSTSEGRAAKYESLVTWSFPFIIRWCNRNRTTKCLKRLQKRSIDDNLRQLVLIRQDRVLVN